MRALRLTKFGLPEGLQLQEVEKPRPQADEVLVRVLAAGLNPSDAGNALGRFEQTTLPRTPGRDLAGVVEEGPDEWTGKHVWATGAELGFTRDGSHAEYVVLPVNSIHTLPATLTPEQAAASGLPYTTAWFATVVAGQIQPGQTVLVTGATGAVGSAAVHIARWKGARVIPVQRKAGGADAVSSDDPSAAVARVIELTEGGGAHLCIDTVGGPLFDIAMQSVALRGRVVVITAQGDGRASIDLRHLYHREAVLTGIDSLKHGLEESARVLQQMTSGFESGSFEPPSDLLVTPMSEGVRAYTDVAAKRNQGKLVLRPHD